MGPYYNLSCEGILSVLRKSINIYIKTVDFNILDKPFFLHDLFVTSLKVFEMLSI